MSEDEKLKLKQEQLDFQRKNLDLFEHLTKGQASIKDMLTEILHHHGKQAIIVLVIVFLSGIVIGTQYRSWLPYMDEVISTVKSTNAVGNTIR